MKIVLTGSLGNISKPLATELIAKGHSVKIISSKAERKQEIEALGAKPAVGSIKDVAFLTETFKIADAVYCMIPPNFREPDQINYYCSIGENYAQAIQQSNVKRVVHLSSWGAHRNNGTGIILGSHNVENILNKLSGVEVTHLRAGSFYYNLLSFVNMVKNLDIIGTNYGGEDIIIWAYPTDIATVAAEELQKELMTGSRIRYVASDECTANETAKVLGTAIGKPNLQWVVYSDEQVRDRMIKNGLPENTVKNLVDLGTSIHNGNMGEDYQLHKPIEMGKIKVKDFAKEFAVAYHQK